MKANNNFYILLIFAFILTAVDIFFLVNKYIGVTEIVQPAFLEWITGPIILAALLFAIKLKRKRID